MPLVNSTNARKPTIAATGPSLAARIFGLLRDGGGITLVGRMPHFSHSGVVGSLAAVSRAVQRLEQRPVEPLAALEAVDRHVLVDPVDRRPLASRHGDRGEAEHG